MKDDIKRKMEFPLNLQLFADEGEGDGESETVDNDSSSSDDSDNSQEQESSESDTAQSLTAEEITKLVNQAFVARETEAQKLAKMTKTEKEGYQKQQREDALVKRETDITRRELRATAIDQLSDRDVPVELADILVYTDADSCKASLTTVATAFQKAVSAAVEERLRGGKPPKRAATNTTTYTKEQIENMSPSEINAHWGEIQESLKNI